MKPTAEQLLEAILAVSNDVRYVASYRDGRLLMRERTGLSNTSSSESDNPTLLKLVSQRGEIDCGGIEFVMIRYGNF